MFKILATYLILCGILLLMTVNLYANAKDPAENVSSVSAIERLDETVLLIIHIFEKQEKSGWSQHRCFIGLKKRSLDGKESIEPVLNLPNLENDSYAITCVNGKIIVTKNSNKKLYLELNLDLIAPTAIKVE